MATRFYEVAAGQHTPQYKPNANARHERDSEAHKVGVESGTPLTSRSSASTLETRLVVVRKHGLHAACAEQERAAGRGVTVSRVHGQLAHHQAWRPRPRSYRYVTAQEVASRKPPHEDVTDNPRRHLLH